MATTTFKNTLPRHWEVDDATGLAAVVVKTTEVGFIAYQRDLGVLHMAMAPTAGSATVWSRVYNNYPRALTPDAVSGAAATVNDEDVVVAVGAVTTNSNDWIVLPAIANVPIGHTITICCNAGGNFECRTPAASGTKINTVDSDGTQELLCTDATIVIVRKVTTTDGWQAVEYAAAGGVSAAVTPN